MLICYKTVSQRLVKFLFLNFIYTFDKQEHFLDNTIETFINISKFILTYSTLLEDFGNFPLGLES